MMQIIPILFCIMISLSQAKEDHHLQEDGIPDSHQVSGLLTARAPGTLDKLRSDERLSFPKPVPGDFENPYIDPKCCNSSTTSACSLMGSDGFKGHCIAQNETCYGKEYEGSYFCSINNLQSCKCCVPTDCAQQTLSPCAKLNGTCMGINDECIGESVTGKEFCKQDTKNETCKCCYLPDCPCGQDYYGSCYGDPFNPLKVYKDPSKPVKKARGRCMKSCDAASPLSLKNNTCNETGGKDCKCCEDCGVKTCSSTTNVYTCICRMDGDQCPYGYCTNPGDVTCPEGSCSCCTYKPPGCSSRKDQCSAPKDYCVPTWGEEGECPKGFAKVIGACSAAFKKPKLDLKKGNSSRIPFTCDCCKSTECSSIRDLCTGPGSYCTDKTETCPDGYEESFDCSKPIIKDGIWITSNLCKCCKPKPINCGDSKKCFRVGNQCFLRLPYNTTWTGAKGVCAKYNNTLAEPECPQAVAQHLTNTYGDESYWIGAHGASNGSSVWVTGGVIGPEAPWFSNCYEKCDGPNCCIDLQANIGCIDHNQCFGCNKCNGGIPRTPLCSCENSFK